MTETSDSEVQATTDSYSVEIQVEPLQLEAETSLCIIEIVKEVEKPKAKKESKVMKPKIGLVINIEEDEEAKGPELMEEEDVVK